MNIESEDLLHKPDEGNTVPEIKLLPCPSLGYWRYQLGDEPEILHIVRSGYEDLYFCFWEDGYEQEPWKSGIKFMTKAEITNQYKVTLEEVIDMHPVESGIEINVLNTWVRALHNEKEKKIIIDLLTEGNPMMKELYDLHTANAVSDIDTKDGKYCNCVIENVEWGSDGNVVVFRYEGFEPVVTPS